MKAAETQRFTWNRTAYDHAVRLGTFAGESHIQLLEGELYQMTPQDPAHAYVVGQLHECLRVWYGEEFFIRLQAPFAASDRSEPEPDLYVVAGRREEYRDRHPDQAVLVIEVSRTSLEVDRTTKASIYAQAGVPEYWVVDVEGKTIEIRRDPRNGRYASRSMLEAHQSILPLNGQGAPVPVESLFS